LCLWDARRGIGGINHYLMPFGEGAGAQGRRFGTVAIPELLATIQGFGAQEKDIRAKVFGGADVINTFRTGEESLGARNVEVALTFLQGRGIPVVNQDVRGTQGRKLIFQTHDGSALIKRLGRSA